MKASVIIATYGRDACLVNTLRSALLQDYPDFELIIVDQTSRHTPEVDQFLRNLDDPRFSYYLVTPPSLPAARNFGLAKATGEVVIYFDDDVELDPGFIQAHVEAFNRHQNLGALGGRVRVQGEEVSTCLSTLGPDGKWTGAFDYPYEADLDAPMGCNMSFRRSVLQEIGGFDPSYEGNAVREETDAAFRVRRRGYQVRYDPKPALDHLVDPVGGCRDKETRRSKTYYQNEAIFNLKNLGLRFFALFFFDTLRNAIWPHKRSFYFWSQLKAFFGGVFRGTWFVLFPKKLQPQVVRELSPARRIKVSENVQP